MLFFSERPQIPSLHKLVKYYLDPLKEVAFKDDRQVQCLTATCSRISDPITRESPGGDAVFVEVERLTDYKQRFSLYFSLLSDSRFEHYSDSDDLHWELDQLVSQINETDYEGLGLPPDKVRWLREFHKAEFQEKLLKLNGIRGDDIPGTPALAKYYAKTVRELRELNPFSINFGDLPIKGQSDQYKQRIRSSVQAFKSKRKDLEKIIVPIELDVQVTPRALRLGKDLDNIMYDICPVIQDELLGSHAYIHGYRVYVTNKLTNAAVGSLLLKLLPMFALIQLRSAIDRVLDDAADRLG